MAVIRTEGLTKYYGRARGILDLNLEVKAGEVFGFLGPNGAGKTTTIRIFLDLLRPTRGTALVLGMVPSRNSLAIRRRVGYLAGDVEHYGNLRGGDQLRYLAALRGGVDWSRVRALADRFILDLSRPIRSLSRGNRQKLSLVQAFMHRPELLILDEPTSGLDPLLQQEFRQLIRETAANGATVFLSSHIMQEVEALCDRVAIVREGKLTAVETIAGLRGRALRRVRVRFADPPPGVFPDLAGISGIQLDRNVLTAMLQGSPDQLIRRLAQCRVEDLVVEEPELEEVFMALYGGI
ncbi:MAG TPA: ABC transporter [Clostridiales bacterium]|nr:ABC transporter [Clostridiales bacterium]